MPKATQLAKLSLAGDVVAKTLDEEIESLSSSPQSAPDWLPELDYIPRFLGISAAQSAILGSFQSGPEYSYRTVGSEYWRQAKERDLWGSYKRRTWSGRGVNVSGFLSSGQRWR